MYRTVNILILIVKKILPAPLVRPFLPFYHKTLNAFFARVYGYPARDMVVIAVTGTKGKSSVAEMLFSILTSAGHKTALASTIRFAIGNTSKPNLFKMTMPGRGFIQYFLARARSKGCTHAVIEVTSESVRQYRHKYLFFNALIFTNLQKEHIESHGSFEKYAEAKLTIGQELERSPKRPRATIANADDESGARFLSLAVEEKIPFGAGDLSNLQVSDSGVSFMYGGVRFDVPQPGQVSALNALAAIKAGVFAGVTIETCVEALHTLARIPGRMEKIDAGQDFLAVVDYAHTPDSLRALYEAFPNRRKICVLGNTGGGRDTWKRPDMGQIADEACEKVILTNEDPYDEDPKKIVHEMAAEMKRTPDIIMDRREAIRTALRFAKEGDAVLISGKGTDPFIMGPRGTKTPWSDARVVREELEALIKNS
jgi:UDP-N-acetylmuramoyl-L-alanyl-D-glutamate--2,6-diaminopimelate ligase